MSAEMDSGSGYLPHAYAPTDPDVAHRARLAVAHHSVDAGECREALEMLDLMPEVSDGQ